MHYLGLEFVYFVTCFAGGNLAKVDGVEQF